MANRRTRRAPTSSSGLRAGARRDQELLVTTLKVLRQTGYDRLTIDAVAAKAHASKSTVYRRWGSKAELVVAAFSAAIPDALPPVDTGSLREDLLALMESLLAELETLSDVIAGLVGEMRRNTDLAAAFERDFLADRVKAVREAFVRARERGEIADAVDVGWASEIVPVMLLHWSLLRRERITRRHARVLIDTVVEMVRP